MFQEKERKSDFGEDMFSFKQYFGLDSYTWNDCRIHCSSSRGHYSGDLFLSLTLPGLSKPITSPHFSSLRMCKGKEHHSEQIERAIKTLLQPSPEVFAQGKKCAAVIASVNIRRDSWSHFGFLVNQLQARGLISFRIQHMDTLTCGIYMFQSVEYAQKHFGEALRFAKNEAIIPNLLNRDTTSMLYNSTLAYFSNWTHNNTTIFDIDTSSTPIKRISEKDEGENKKTERKSKIKEDSITIMREKETITVFSASASEQSITSEQPFYCEAIPKNSSFPLHGLPTSLQTTYPTNIALPLLQKLSNINSQPQISKTESNEGNALSSSDKSSPTSSPTTELPSPHQVFLEEDFPTLKKSRVEEGESSDRLFTSPLRIAGDEMGHFDQIATPSIIPSSMLTEDEVLLIDTVYQCGGNFATTWI
eukprot:TRINITY_DN797_c0_g2_i4.p1 TRINITY_DN797_c0_g2~~TRINITY_DN797_c0_g2_i4.p1  ORF type:complete len:418 (-),score=114.33 TRINITY_DN797_c0_g2_i4:47-1300(-)